MHQEFTKSVELGEIPCEKKFADVTPVFNKEDPTNKENYRPISILSNLSRVFDACVTNLQYFLRRYFQNANADLEKTLMLNIVQLNI